INSLFSISKPEVFVKNFFRFIFQSIFVHRLDSILTAVETAYSGYQTFHHLSRTFFQILFWYAEPLFENSLFRIPLFPLFCQQLFFIFLHFMQTLEILP
ncbi:hypothetical protein, partial [Butyricicoccus sp. OF27-2pH9A]|uniref:hypothetical protein n=1 Tax=Butyricicoccus sp. OF27-2pH9A TaxID=3002517 RepID=UPI0022E5927D